MTNPPIPQALTVGVLLAAVAIVETRRAPGSPRICEALLEAVEALREATPETEKSEEER